MNGITAHLDYLQDLGVDAIWITPFYPSPQVDFGYDVTDYNAIDPQYGAMADFDRLAAEAAKHKIKLITDLVLNHTSDRHPWFIESRSSRTNPKADWYVWVDGKEGTPPNNWLSIFGHSAWEWDPTRQQYYYHAFYKQQPDLNWRNQQVRNAMYDMIRGWMKRGVAGFRLDAVPHLFEDPKLTNEKVLQGLSSYGDRITERLHTDNLPEVHQVYRELRQLADSVPGTMMIGETYLPNVEQLAQAYGAHNDELQLPMDTQYGMHSKLSADLFRSKLRDAETGLNGNMPLFVFDNHDNRRSWNRFGDGQHDDAIARLIATLLLTPRATALMYYGQELGMSNSDPKSIDQVKDPIGKIGWPKEIGRDGERTPMQWSAGTDAGFSTAASTWLPVAPNYSTVNVATETGNPASLRYGAGRRLRTQDHGALRPRQILVGQETTPRLSRNGSRDTSCCALQPFSREAPQAYNDDAIATFTPSVSSAWPVPTAPNPRRLHRRHAALGHDARRADSSPPIASCTAPESGHRWGGLSWRLGGGDTAEAVARSQPSSEERSTRTATPISTELHALAPGKSRIVDKMPGNYH